MGSPGPGLGESGARSGTALPAEAGSTATPLASHDAVVDLHREVGYRFRVEAHQPAGSAIYVDEPAPIGAGTGPEASRLLAAAVGQCLSSSLLFCLEKARVTVGGLHTSVRTQLGRNPNGRLRVTGLAVVLRPEVAPADRARMARCLDIFQEYCVVTASLSGAIPVEVAVRPVPDDR